MYESFFGLKEKPFNLLPDPHYLYMSDGHENAYTHLEYAIAENKGFVVITGEIGSGKTTLINFLLEQIPQDIQVGIINNTDISPGQLIKMVSQEFELESSGMDKAEMLENFNRYLLDRFSNNHRVVLIIDEAQNLPLDTMEEIRMLSNLEAEKHHLIQIILVGQPELRSQLQSPRLKQLVQRVTVHSHLEGLNLEEVEKYIRHRLHIAGAASLEVFSQPAIESIFQYSRGIPRLINLLCDTALVYGFADDQKTITEEIVHQIVESRQIGGIFTKEQSRDEEETAGAPIAIGEMAEQYIERLESFERRMMMVEDTVASIDQKFNIWVTKREERDSGLYELVKLLRESLKSRQRVINKYMELRRSLDQQIDHFTAKPDDDDYRPQKVSLFARMSGKNRR